MTIKFNLEYNPKTQQLKIIDDNPFNNVWLGADSFDRFNNPNFELSHSYGHWTIKTSRSEEWYIASGRIQRRNYSSFQKIEGGKETFIFSRFNEVERTEDGKWVNVDNNWN